jgi:hypothetical protein
MKFFSRFVDSNDRELRRLQPIVDEANELEEEIAALSDDEIRERFNEIREEILEIAAPDEPSEDERHHPDLERRRELAKARRKKENDRIQSALDQVASEVFAMGREAMKRTLGMRQYDVQIMGGVVLHQGKIAEMKTGEGKTFIPTFAAVLNSLTGRGVHIVTVNDYLARRDPQWMGPSTTSSVSVGTITYDESFVFEPGYPTTDERLINLRPGRREPTPPTSPTARTTVRVRLPPRQHGHRARPAGQRAEPRSSTRSTTSSSTGPDADHQRPGEESADPTTRSPASRPGSGAGLRARRRAATLRRPQG